jgi:hypothetical protein
VLKPLRTIFWLIRIRCKLSLLARAALIVVIMVAWVPADLEPVRWWMSKQRSTAVGLTLEQVMMLDRLYEGDLAARRRLSAKTADVMVRISGSLHDGDYDGALLHLTEELAQAYTNERILRRQMLERTVGMLTPDQKPRVIRLAEGGLKD